MDRCDFASIMSIIRRYVNDDAELNQPELAALLFTSFCDSDAADNYAFDEGQICRWMSGQSRVTPKVIDFYSMPVNQRKLAEDIQNELFPVLSDSSMACQEIYDLTVQDPSISSRMKKKLTKGFSSEDDKAAASFLAGVLCFGMEREFVKRPFNTKALPTGGIQSPVVSEHIFGADVPHPCRHFCGRDKELAELHDLLSREQMVFITGIPGIGKSELTKAYARMHKKDYTNIIYITYTGNLRHDIANMDFADDPLFENESERFFSHDRFLCTLKEDSLLIIDNFNTTASAEKTLRSIRRYNCRILFTSRSRWDKYPVLELTEISDMKDLLGLTSSFYSATVSNTETVTAIIEAVHRHTLAVELAARLLENGILTPEELLSRFQSERAAMSSSDKVNISKDGHTKKQTYYDHIRLLFSLYTLSEDHKHIMRCMSFMPASGIFRRLFASWLMLPDMNDINDLTEAGFILPKPIQSIALHPMIKEVAQADLSPSITNCRTLFDNIYDICQLHGMDIPWYRDLFQVIETIVMEIENDDMPSYLLFIEDAIQYMDNYNYTDGIARLQAKMKQLLKDPSVGTAKDRALFLHNQAYLEKDPKKQIAIYKKALKISPEISENNALLVSNLHANIGNLYRITGNFKPAEEHIMQAIQILKEHDMAESHDGILQFVNYGLLLNDEKRYEEAFAVLNRAEQIIAADIGNSSSDYAEVQEALGIVSLQSGEIEEGIKHLKTAANIYDKLYEGDEELLQSKYQQIMMYYPEAGRIIAEQILDAHKE